jgi:hypothetical protein
LFYHFQKSQDFERAKRYADMIQESVVVIQDQAIEYAKRILEEREERAYPLSKKSIKLIADVCRSFYIISINMTLYPAGSEMIAAPVEDLFRKLSEIFVRDEVVVLKDYKNTLVVNGEKLKETDLKNSFSQAILDSFKERNMESITFKRGLSKNELITFIESFAGFKGDRPIAEVLKSKLIFKIKVREIDYAATSVEGPAAIGGLQEAKLLEQLLSQGFGSGVKQQDILSKLKEQPQEISRMLSQFADSVAKSNPTDSPLSNERVRTEAIADSIQKLGEQISASNIH